MNENESYRTVVAFDAVSAVRPPVVRTRDTYIGMIRLEPLDHRLEPLVENIQPRCMLLYSIGSLVHDVRAATSRRHIGEEELAPAVRVDLFRQRLIPSHQLRDDLGCVCPGIRPADAIPLVSCIPSIRKGTRLINPNPKPKHRTISSPRCHLWSAAICRLEEIHLGNQIRRPSLHDRVVDSSPADGEVVRQDQRRVLLCGQESDPVGSAGCRADSWACVSVYCW